MDLESINKFHDKISIETKEILAKIDNRIKFLEEHSNLKFSQEIKMNLDFKNLFDDLKSNQINHIEIFNKLSDLKLEDGTSVLNPDNRNNLIKNINIVNSTLIKYYDLIPNYNLHLENLPNLNIELVRSTSPELTEASLQVENLNTNVEKS
jgi:predicted restriction endonuclease